jgi:double-stranded uracil-DNA glycosylase
VNHSTTDPVEGFPPIAASDARLLILGSAPSVESLKQQQYYAHPRNSFWSIVVSLLHPATEELGYNERTLLLQQNHIALWDVMRSCERPGSLDSAIVAGSIQTNPFNLFFTKHPEIQALFFNGAKAEETYRKRVLPDINNAHRNLKRFRLPSTSPAMATLNFAEKRGQWRLLLDYC